MLWCKVSFIGLILTKKLRWHFERRIPPTTTTREATRWAFLQDIFEMYWCFDMASSNGSPPPAPFGPGGRIHSPHCCVRWSHHHHHQKHPWRPRRETHSKEGGWHGAPRICRLSNILPNKGWKGEERDRPRKREEQKYYNEKRRRRMVEEGKKTRSHNRFINFYKTGSFYLY